MPESLIHIRQQLKERGICVIIPTYNNAGTLSDVVKRVSDYCEDIIVVNDGSTDETSSILKRMQNVTVVEYPRNKGKGYALKRGFLKARTLGFAYAISLDADGQHLADDIPAFLSRNKEYPNTLIVGHRDMKGTEQSRGSRFANRFADFWFFVQTGRRHIDTQCGYRLYPIKRLHGLRWLTSRYEAELELLVFSVWHGTRLATVPIHVYYPPREERVSHFRPFMDFFRISVLNTVLCLLTVLYGLPLGIGRFAATVFRTAYTLLLFVFFSLFVITPAIWLYAKVGKMTEKKRLRIHRFMQRIARFVLITHGIPGTKFTYRMSDENMDLDRPRVVICNHQSHLDLMCLLVFSPRIVFLTNNWVWKNPFFGFLIRTAEYLPASEGIESLMPKLKDLVSRGYSIAIFPEGTRSFDCRIGRFHQGAFYVAERLGLDILPVLLYGPGKVLPKKSYYLRKGRLHTEILAPVSINRQKEMGDYRKRATEFRRMYREEYEHLTHRMEQL